MKKKLLFLLVITAMFVGCKTSDEEKVSNEAISNPLSAESGEQVNTEDLPAIRFEKELHDFGTINEGEKVTYSFRFTNTGKSDLIIQTASGSCGCTVPEVPEKPIKPGESGFIKVQFNSEGRIGVQEKQVTVVSNTIPNTTIVKIRAEVSER